VDRSTVDATISRNVALLPNGPSPMNMIVASTTATTGSPNLVLKSPIF
jgi:formylmethanofuran dehydrogenase subunit D